MSEYLPQICTPSGKTLKFKLPWDLGDQHTWFRNLLNPRYVRPGLVKNRLPLLGLWNAQDGHYVFAADFDGIAEDATDAVIEELQFSCPTALVTKSVSGKPKAFFLVKSPIPLYKDSIAFEWLQNQIPHTLQGFLDKAGIRTLFVNERLYRELGDWLPSAYVHRPFEREDLIDSTKKTVAEKPSFRYFENDTALPPELQDWVDAASCEEKAQLREKLLRILGAAWNLATKEFDLPTTRLAAQIGTDPASVSRLLSDLRRKGLLECTSDKYCPGHKAKSFRASGALAAWISEHMVASLAKTPRKKASVKTLTEVEPQQWWKTCLRALREFQVRDYHDGDGYMRWVEGLAEPGTKRWKEAKRYLACELRKPLAA